ncbi:F-box/WD repeat-containing protein 7-like isoform X1 [Kryptolebias marmoratus]|uniref:F-box/WD repeat-containing protein 7 n=1 Tax=Kryptolebias marmoratus TaxID=37003 RepID=A0A3Q3A5M4_KRYMA|nr:F-box/WD repeat-containing protein 7-like isoform X1 [Kryptolebias marmoratus]
MKEELGGRRADEEEEERTHGPTEKERGEEDGQRQVKLRSGGEKDEEEIQMMVTFRDKTGNEAMDGRALISASSSTFSSFSFLSSSVCRGSGEEDEVRISLVTVEDESCPSEPFGSTNIEPANQVSPTEDEGGKEEERGATVEGVKGEEDEQLQMKRKLDHGPDGRPFPSGKKHCKGNGYLSPSSLAQATPTTFGDLRLANGHSAQRRRVTSGPPPSGLQDWLLTFQAWSGPERLLALDELIDRCQTSQVKHMMQVIEPQFQRDFISLLPKELALYVLTFLAPRDLLRAAQTCRYWRILAEDNLLWREKCREEGVSECLPYRSRECVRPGAAISPWKSAYIRQHRIETNWRKGDEREPMVLKGHDDHVITCLQFSGDLIVSGSDDNTLKVWSAITGKCLRTLTGHTGGVWCSQMTVATVISGSTDRTLRVWDAESGDCVHTLYGHTSTVRCMHLHGNRVVSGSRDTTLRVWDVLTGRCEHVLTGHVAAVRCVQYDGRRVVSGGYDYMVKVWDPETEVCLHTLQGHTNRVYSLQFDGVFVVSGSLDTSIRVWDAETGGCIQTLTGHQSLTSGMELRDNILVSGNADSTVRVWDIRTGQCLHTLQGPNKHQSAVTCLQFCRGLVLSSSDDGTVKLWDLRTGAWLRDVVALQSRGSGGVVWRIRASDTRLVCAAGSRNGTEETKLLVLDFDLDGRKQETDTK